ncbi:hypothetical protein PPERSA_05884 [Pseudocohnilembus persalinus]|uniref:Uncharacterized protein n=1 Tax=Pseudocohnilembus persalinus TaxID=266149 RepID=A0A0V0R412_PSEPJ|nr:hypothetical protein PPERSA_05884 [Pseudocohnilembus persalinus]|eukprot:KRX09215.1 hypothetical protein PPERSA_05884 [Pseudocohnilembus persalinus]
MFLKPKENAEFEQEFTSFVPKEGEVRAVANKNTACAYYLRGIEQCRRRVLELAGNPNSENHDLGFLPCKKIVDAHYRCMTDEQFGHTIEEAPEYTQPFVNKFFDCTFKEMRPFIKCRPHFDNIVRNIYRQEGALDDTY